MTRFVAAFDLHFGKEKRGGKIREIHDPRAMEGFLRFASDFKPQAVVLGGDTLDCGAISRHNAEAVGLVEGLRLAEDFEGLKREFLSALPKAARRIFHIGNHEDWVRQLTERIPALEGVVDVEKGLGLKEWEVIPQGGVSRIGKLHFIHGDTIRGRANPAQTAVNLYERSIRFGHFHKFSAFTKTSALDITDVRTGVGVPGLCRRDPFYGKGAPNGHALGFLWGYVHRDGTFSDYVSIISGGRFVANGKEYRVK